MGLYQDYEDAKAQWSRLGWSGKLLTAFSLVLSALSITSIADSVFQFKGFVAQGIAFYQTVIRPPFAALWGWFGLEFKPYQVDLLMLNILVSAAIVRSAPADVEDRSWRQARAFIALVLIDIVVVAWFESNAAVAVSSCVPIWFYFFDEIKARTTGCQRLFHRNSFLFQFAVMLMGIGVVAAVSEGLVR